jgi:hypothetical protein
MVFSDCDPRRYRTDDGRDGGHERDNPEATVPQMPFGFQHTPLNLMLMGLYWCHSSAGDINHLAGLNIHAEFCCPLHQCIAI